MIVKLAKFVMASSRVAAGLVAAVVMAPFIFLIWLATAFHNAWRHLLILSGGKDK
jgi:hypothetical protein